VRTPQSAIDNWGKPDRTMGTPFVIEARGPFPGRLRHRWRIYLVGDLRGGPYTSFIAGFWTRRGAQAEAVRLRAVCLGCPGEKPND